MKICKEEVAALVRGMGGSDPLLGIWLGQTLVISGPPPANGGSTSPNSGSDFSSPSSSNLSPPQSFTSSMPADAAPTFSVTQPYNSYFGTNYNGDGFSGVGGGFVNW